MEYHEVRIVAELRKQGEHERAEEFRLKAMRRTRRRIPEHLVPLAGTPRTPHPVRGREEAMQYHKLRILCAVRDKIAENDTRLTGHQAMDRARARDDTLGFRIA
jgi:hypothetical protein